MNPGEEPFYEREIAAAREQAAREAQRNYLAGQDAARRQQRSAFIGGVVGGAAGSVLSNRRSRKTSDFNPSSYSSAGEPPQWFKDQLAEENRQERLKYEAAVREYKYGEYAEHVKKGLPRRFRKTYGVFEFLGSTSWLISIPALLLFTVAIEIRNWWNSTSMGLGTAEWETWGNPWVMVPLFALIVYPLWLISYLEEKVALRRRARWREVRGIAQPRFEEFQ